MKNDILRARSHILSCALIGIIFTLIGISYSKSIYELNISSEKLNQKVRSNILVQKIQNYTAISNQLSRTLQVHFNHSKYSQSEIEKFLIESVKSGPSDLIYGVGLWYEPFKYYSTQKYFGPYVNRDLKNLENVKVTYEWNSEKYNYHNQDWYIQAKNFLDSGKYIEPYFDVNYVYVTFSHVFYDQKNQVNGVITVDMILPQLQSLIEEVNQNKDEIFYIESGNGFLLAHPDQKKLIDLQINTLGNNKKNLIEFSINELKKTLNNKEHESDYFKASHTVPELGWKVVIETNKKIFLKNFYRGFKIILSGLVMMWIFLVLIMLYLIKAKKAEFDSEKRNKEQEVLLFNSAKLATLGEFSSGIAHEINNPLSIIYGKSDLLMLKLKKNNIENSDISKEIQKIKSNAERISQIIRGLKIFSREGIRDPMDHAYLDEIIKDTFSISSELLKSKNIQLIIDKIPQISIRCRPTQISQVLLNLLTNSIHAIQNQAGPWIKVEVHVGSEIQIIITDSGLGIEKKIADKMMEPFYTTKEVGKGTGLGLSISYGILKEHGGRLEYNLNSKNTQFEIFLPLIQPF